MSDILKQACPDFRSGGYCDSERAHPGIIPLGRITYDMHSTSLNMTRSFPMCGAGGTDGMRRCHAEVLREEAEK